MHSTAKTVDQYLKSLPSDRKHVLETVRNAILKRLPKGYEEIMQYGMISYAIPLSKYPKGYGGDGKTPMAYVCLAAQKNYYAVYLTNVYANSKLLDWFISEYKKSGKKLDMGKGCVRFRKLENLPVELIGEVVAKTTPDEMIKNYETMRQKR